MITGGSHFGGIGCLIGLLVAVVWVVARGLRRYGGPR
jgi:hypothetical protein